MFYRHAIDDALDTSVGAKGLSRASLDRAMAELAQHGLDLPHAIAARAIDAGRLATTGLTRVVSALWPFAALAWLLGLAGNRARSRSD